MNASDRTEKSKLAATGGFLLPERIALRDLDPRALQPERGPVTLQALQLDGVAQRVEVLGASAATNGAVRDWREQHSGGFSERIAQILPPAAATKLLFQATFFSRANRSARAMCASPRCSLIGHDCRYRRDQAGPRTAEARPREDPARILLRQLR